VIKFFMYNSGMPSYAVKEPSGDLSVFTQFVKIPTTLSTGMEYV